MRITTSGSENARLNPELRSLFDQYLSEKLEKLEEIKETIPGGFCCSYYRHDASFNCVES